jgi:hypothetical protein
VRPTDENQAGSTRPNLMSSRRGAGEENILAMLERDSARRIGIRMSGLRLASYGAAAALVGILAGGVAWLAYDNHKGAQELQARHDAAVVVRPVMPDGALPPPAPSVVAPAPVVEAPRTAVIVDESASKRDTTVAGGVPPLVMLPPQELNGAKPVAPAPRTMQESVPAKPVAPAPRTMQESVPAKPAKPEPARVAARSGGEKKPEKAAKPASRPAKPALARASGPAKAKPEVATRARKPAPSAEAPVDSDVALISAIIQHSERHRGEREAAGACNGAKCPPKAGRP